MPGYNPADEVVGFVQDLIRIESVNTGVPETIGDGEARAARYIQNLLHEVGYETTYIEPVPGRGNVIARLAGSGDSRDALLLHAHLDVVPVNASEWSVPPFSGEIVDGVLYGRGAVDMKNMAGMLLAVARALKADGVTPSRDIVFAWLSDEENGGVYGSEWLTTHHGDLLEGVTEAISECGGFSFALPDGRRAYLIATAEKGALRARMTTTGTAGHGALVNDDNPVTRMAGAVDRLGSHRFPVLRTPHLEELLTGLTEATGLDFSDDDTVDAQLDRLGWIAKLIRASLRNTANPTMFTAGYKRNVIPSTAEAWIDCRILPDTRDEFVAEFERLAGPGIDIDWTFGWTIESPVDAPVVTQMRAAILAEDPDAVVIPFLLPGGTDNKLFSKIGINGYGFVPLRVPPGFDVFGLYHAVDERVPVDSLLFGARVLNHLLRKL